MGLRQALRLTRAAGDPLLTGPGNPPRFPLAMASPWQDSDALARLTFDELWGAEAWALTRTQAMTVPAVARSRHLICQTGARVPLQAWRGDELLAGDAAPTWTYRTDGDVSPYHRMLWTLDDLLFTGWALWSVTRDAAGHVLTADRVPRDAWTFDDAGRVLVGDMPLRSDVVVLIPGPHEGILTFGVRTIRAAADAERAFARAARNPVPDLELHQLGGVPMTDDEIDRLVARWNTARSGAGGGVGFTDENIEVRTHGQAAEQLLIEGRNSSAVDVARMVGLPAAMIDATTAAASLTYETTQGRSQQFLDLSLQAYLDTVAARLSQDDVVPRGTRVTFDVPTLTDPTGPTGAGPSTLD